MINTHDDFAERQQVSVKSELSEEPVEICQSLHLQGLATLASWLGAGEPEASSSDMLALVQPPMD